MIKPFDKQVVKGDNGLEIITLRSYVSLPLLVLGHLKLHRKPVLLFYSLPHFAVLLSLISLDTHRTWL